MKSENEKKSQSPLAIVGIGCLFPKSDGLKSYWANIRERVDCVTDIPESHWKPEDYFNADQKTPDMTYGKRGGFLSPVDFDCSEFGITPNNISATDPAQLLSLVAAREALRDAGYGEGKVFDRKKVSVILGVTGTLEIAIPLGARLGHPYWRRALKEHGIEGEQAESIIKSIADSYVGWQENSFPGLLGNVVAGRIANRLDLGGTNCVVDAACASSLSAAHLACMELETGRADMVITGGVDTFNDIFMYMCFSKTPALSPTGNSRPFDADGDGTILGEGIGMVVIKRLADAERDGDRIYAVLKGIGSSSDGKGKAIYAPSAEGQMQALKKAYEASGVSPETIELVEAHGTGTKVGDAEELKSLTSVYRDAKKDGTWAALGSVKSQLGHTKAAAGSAGLIKAVMALHNKTLPPTIKIRQPLADLASGTTPFYANTEKRPWLTNENHPRRAAVSAFGFGGSNFHAILEEYKPGKVEVDTDGTVQIFAYSADTIEGLKKAVSPAPAAGAATPPNGRGWDEVRVLAHASRAAFEPSKQFRISFVVEKDSDFSKTLKSALENIEKNVGKKAWTTPDGVCFGSGAPAGKTGFLFSGQGSQYVGMGRDLACAYPRMFDSINAAGRELSDKIYPYPAFDDAAKAKQEDELRATMVAQPAIGAVALGMLGVMEDFGVKPEAVAGHSYGELAALCAAGVYGVDALQKLSRLRGELMSAGGGDKGTMLAVIAPLADVEKVLAEEKLDVVIANKNAPKQSVLSGSKAAIAQAAEVFTKRGMKNTPLPVAAAFHSKLVADAKTPFRAALAKVDFKKPAIPVYANTTAAPYPADAEKMRDLLGGQLAAPVEFVAEIERMYADGVRTFVEVGPGARMTGLVKAILDGKEFDAVSVDASNGKRHGIVDLARALAQLAASGCTVNLSKWENGEEGVKDVLTRKKPKVSVSVGGGTPVGPAAKGQKPELIKKFTPVVKEVIKEVVREIPVASTNTSANTPLPVYGERKGEGIMPSAAMQGLAALQKIQEQTAQLHKQFLEGQEATQRMLLQLVSGQPANFTVPVSVYQAPAPAKVEGKVRTMSGHSTQAPLSQPLPGGLPLPKSAPVAVPAPAADSSVIETALLAVVSEKTGYPAETLNLDMGMESDLGIDSIKRVEILSAMRERLPGAPVVGPQHIGTLRTLRQVIEFLSAGMSEIAIPPQRPGVSGHTSVPAAAVSTSKVEEALLAVVAEKTGYPAETLNLDMGMESDLGIDSIKRVEILSAMRERLPGAPVVGPQHIGTLRTLRQVIDFLSAGMMTAEPLSQPLPVNGERGGVASAAPSSVSAGVVETALLAVVAEKTGYPADTLNLDMGMEADLGIDSIKRVEILSALREKLPSSPVVGPQHIGTLRTLRQVIEFLTAGKREAVSPTPAAVPAATPPNGGGSVGAPGVYLRRSVLRAVEFAGNGRESVAVSKKAPLWVTDDGAALSKGVVEKLIAAGYKAKLVTTKDLEKVPAGLAGLIVVAPKKDSERAVKDAFLFAKAAGAELRASRGVFITVSRLDGAFGLKGMTPEMDPVSGGLAGLSKTAFREWDGVSCRAIDVAAKMKEKDAAAAIVEEMEFKGPLEMGISGDGKISIEMVETELSPTPALRATPPNGGGVEEGDVILITGGARGVTAETAVALAKAYKPTLVLFGRTAVPDAEPTWAMGLSSEAEIKKAIVGRLNGKAAPKAIEEEYRRLVTHREVLQTLKRIEEAGGRAEYRSVDLTDAQAVKAAMAEVLKAFGPVKGIVHGAGVLADKVIEEKTPMQFDAVFDTKVAGLRNLLGTIDEAALKFVVLFSSVSGRYGRKGQCDYAMANEVLNKTTYPMTAALKGCRVVSIGWGPWDGGMVNASLKKVFEAEGVAVIPLKEGGEYLVREIEQIGGAIEVIVEATVSPTPAPVGATPPNGRGEMVLAFERVVDLRTHGFLESHVIGGNAVLPMAITGEWLAHGAIVQNPGMQFLGFEDMRVFKGVVLKDGSAIVRIMVGKATAGTVPVEMRGTDGVLYAGARVLLGNKVPAFAGDRMAPAKGNYLKSIGRVYKDILFHGPEMQTIEKVTGFSGDGIMALTKPAPLPRDWMKEPLRSSWLTDPSAIDTAFQLLILWTYEKFGAPSLPNYAKEYRQYRAFPRSGVTVNAKVTKASDTAATADIEFSDDKGVIAVMAGYECAINIALVDAFKKKLSTPALLS